MVKLGAHTLELPLLQGGMGVGVSMGSLAGAVAACGALGCISTANIGYAEPDFLTSPNTANLRALAAQIKMAKQIAKGRGMVAVNAMVATRQYAEAVKAAAEAGADAIICGAGLPLDLPGLVGDAASKVALAPIVSSGRAAALLCKTWRKHYDRLPDFIVIEGCRAGGHLGFAEADLLSGQCSTLEELLPEVLAATEPYGNIPVFVAGGIYIAADVRRYMSLGAAGVQVATRFIPTFECDAAQGYKDVLLAAKAENVRIIHSPVGMPGRALATPLVQKLMQGKRFPPKHCSACIKSCRPAEIPYCITHALIEAVRGNVEDGLFFCGDNVGRLDKMQTVAEVVRELFPAEPAPCGTE